MEKTASAGVESLRKAHVALLGDLQRLEAMVEPVSKEPLQAVRAHLDATSAHIREHFRFEEQNGYMAVAREREPRLERAIEQLAGEHREIAQSLAALIGEAKDAKNVSDHFREGIRDWIKGVRQHEHRENDLIQDVFVCDIAAED